MKNVLYLFVFLVAACSLVSKDVSPSRSDALLLKEPKTVTEVKESQLPGGLQSLADKQVTGLFIYNLPDSYLIKAKALFNPPDSAAQEVINLQTDRQGWMDESVVTYCGECKNIKIEIPFGTLPESLLLKLIDKASLKQDVIPADLVGLKKYFPKAQVLWLILGSEDYEQQRGVAENGSMISAIAENTVTLRSYIYDLETKKWLHRSQVIVSDRDFAIYQKLNEGQLELNQKPKILTDNFDGKFWPMPVGASYDSPKYDEVYPYPPVPESSFLIKRALSDIGGTVNP